MTGELTHVRVPHPRLVRRLRVCATVLAVAITLVGAGHLVAWLSGFMAERSLSAIIMKTNAAVGLLATGISLVLLTSGKAGKWQRAVAQGLAVLSTLLGSLTLVENLTGWDLGIDQLVASEPHGALGTFGANRMGMPGSSSFLLAGLSLLHLSRPGDRNARRSQAFALGVCLIAMLASIGYLYGAQSMYTITRFTAIAWPTALSLFGLGLGLLLARSAEGFMAQLTADDPGGVALRRWPPVLLLPVALGWLRLSGERLGLFDAATGTAMTMISVIVALAWVAYRGSLAVSRSSAAIVDREERLRLSHEAARVGSFDWNLATGVIDWTPELEAIHGLSPGQFPKTREAWEALVHPDDRAVMVERIQSAISAGEPIEGEWRVVAPDKSVRCMAGRWRVIRGYSGVPVRMVGVNIEVTERNRMQTALEESVRNLRRSNEQLEQFAYICAHDLQEPLRQVRLFVELLEKQYAPELDGKARQYLNYVSSGAARMIELVKGVLDYSRAGVTESSHEPIEFSEILSSTISNLGMAIAEAGAQITHDPLPLVHGSRTQLNQLLENLISNAIKFRRDGVAPRIHVSCRREQDHWLLSIQDNGIGIPQEYHQRVFRIFQRLHPAQKYQGTGIGLAICQKIVEAHGGKIWIEAQQAQGATFCFTLPAG